MAILNATIAYNAAYAKGDKAGMDAAHAAAEAIRNNPSSTTTSPKPGNSSSSSSTSTTSGKAPTTVLVPQSNGTLKAVDGYISNDLTYFNDGTRISAGSYVYTAGKWYVLGSDGKGHVVSDIATVQTPGKDKVTGVLYNDRTYMPDGSRPVKGAVVIAGDGKQWEMQADGSGKLIISDSSTNIKKLLDTARLEVGYVQHGDTKYGVWYDSYVKSDIYAGEAWCVMFASWCASEAGLLYDGKTNSNGLFPGKASTQEMINWYAAGGRYTKRVDDTGKNYIPQAGDLIFFKWVTSGNGHTGVVEYYDRETKMVHTIEGNTSRPVMDKNGKVLKNQSGEVIKEWVVQRKVWELNDYNIRGYGKNSK